MPLKILVVPDKFKGTLTSAAAAECIRRGWLRSRPGDAVECLPMSDGGDGFGEVLGTLLGAETRHCQTVDAAGQPRTARWWFQAARRLAIVESAQVIGLALLPTGQFHPFTLDTRGLAAVLRDATEAGATSILVGIGGSATNDAGFGLASALGWTFLDGAGRVIHRWPDLARLQEVRPPQANKPLAPIVVAVDVGNPLLGPQGASRIYGPQKGLRAEDMEAAESALGQLVEVLERAGMPARADQPGAGAAGGLGYGLAAFAHARLENGFARYAEAVDLRSRVAAVDLVISGEGSLDQSTLMGKGVGGVARLCQQLGVPCLGLTGLLGMGVDPAQPSPFLAVRAIAPGLAEPVEARARAEHWLAELAAQTAAEAAAILRIP